MSIQVVPLQPDKREVKRFVRFAEDVYRDDDHWVQPLIGDQVANILSGPFTRIGTRQLLMAYRDGHPAARLSVHVSSVHDQQYGVGRGFFGFFEALDDVEIVRAIFATGEEWLREHGCREVVGPLSFSIYEEVGLLVDGLDEDPVVMCPYNPPYYGALLEAAGYTKEVDWYGYRFDRRHRFPPAMERIHRRVLARDGVEIRRVRDLEWDAAVDTVKALFNEAWEKNWGHVPMTDAQWEHGKEELKLAIVRELSWIVYAGGRPVGFYVTVKDLNPALKKAKGRLLPLGWLRILWHARSPKRLRVLIMGFREAYWSHGYALALVYEMVTRALAMGVETCDCSQIVETNRRMVGTIEGIGGQRYRTFRVYRKSLNGV